MQFHEGDGIRPSQLKLPPHLLGWDASQEGDVVREDRVSPFWGFRVRDSQSSKLKLPPLL